MRGAELIAAERQRQIVVEGHFPEDDHGRAVELAYAATAYAIEASTVAEVIAEGGEVSPEGLAEVPAWWPWHFGAWKPTGDPVRDLTKAGALIAAAIDSLVDGGAKVSDWDPRAALAGRHGAPSPLAGQTVRVHLIGGEAVEEFVVEDWWDRVSGHSWQESIGNPAAVTYSIRAAFIGLPADDEVLYGKVGAFGRLVHVSELVREEVAGDGQDEAA